MGPMRPPVPSLSGQQQPAQMSPQMPMLQAYQARLPKRSSDAQTLNDDIYASDPIGGQTGVGFAGAQAGPPVSPPPSGPMPPPPAMNASGQLQMPSPGPGQMPSSRKSASFPGQPTGLVDRIYQDHLGSNSRVPTTKRTY